MLHSIPESAHFSAFCETLERSIPFLNQPISHSLSVASSTQTQSNSQFPPLFVAELLCFVLNVEKKGIPDTKMQEDCYAERPLFGGAIASVFPLRFQDVSNIRQVPDHQEAFVDPARDESLIFELLDLKPDVADNGSAAWFLGDLATEQAAEGAVVIEQSEVIRADGLCFRNMPAFVTTAVGQMVNNQSIACREVAISHLKGTPRKGSTKYGSGKFVFCFVLFFRFEILVLQVYLANLRLKEVGTDILITAYEPIIINPLSETASTVGAGPAIPAAQSGCMPVAEVFELAVSSFKVNDWSIFGAAA